VKNKTANLSFFGGRTTVAGILLAPDILAHSILDSATGTELLNIDADSVDVYSQAFTYNGDDVATVDSVDAAIAAAIAGLGPLPDATATQNLSAVPGTSTFTGLVEADDLAIGTHASVEATLVALEDKTLNLSASTLSTSLEGSLTLRGGFELDLALLGVFGSSEYPGNPSTEGWSFTSSEPLSIRAVGIPTSGWSSTFNLTPRAFKLWAQGVPNVPPTAPIFATTIVRDNPTDGYYTTVVDWELPAGATAWE
jgi:hypothetical protein